LSTQDGGIVLSAADAAGNEAKTAEKPSISARLLLTQIECFIVFRP